MDFSLIIFFVITAAFLILLFWYLGRKSRFTRADRKFFQEKWSQIRQQKDFRHALMDADKLLDFALQKRGYQGSLGEKLKAGGKIFSHLDDVWYAHKLRNRLAHELDFHPSHSEMKRSLDYFYRALEDLKAF